MKKPTHKTCIFCLENKPISDFSIEHVFPESIGGSFKTYNVCTDCNSFLGTSVDAVLFDNLFVKGRCQVAKVRGKNGKIPNIFRRGKLAEDKSRDVHYYFDEGGAPERLYITPKIEINENGILHVEADGHDSERLLEMVNKKLNRSGNKELSASELMEMIESKEKPVPEIIYGGGIYVDFYIRALFKIVYELGVYWLGLDYIYDDTAAKIREIVLNDNFDINGLDKYEIRGDLDLLSNLDKPLFDLWVDYPDYHFAYISQNDLGSAIVVRIFDICGGYIYISEDYTNTDFDNPRALVLDPVGKTYREDKLVKFLSNREV